ncbi:glycosyltransferase family 4 protein [Rhizobium sp.]|jgi:glycosyltransferase involved in cell wall biosynthesis|uniref:glycosyltransferase family 4 protein n=1 Tax=Rhizobium sp. TaxID=391 RepID=UPI000E94DB3D|nr:glycosyl transferase [Rhizobium sp.]
MKIAFYAPLKSPNHPVPSGDRLMARLLLRALTLAGHEVVLASELRSFHKNPDTELPDVRAAVASEVERLTKAYKAGEKPDLWFCYHPYYKAPDWIGSELCQRFDMPYVTAEASYSQRRNLGVWAEFQAHLLETVKNAALNLCFTERDVRGLEAVAPQSKLTRLSPFIDAEPFLAKTPLPEPGALATVAMMRPGDKMSSYTTLAQALSKLEYLPWRLRVVGDGPCGDAVRALFAGFSPGRIEWLGEQPPEAVAEILSTASLYVWPGHGEAYGLAYLEAQAMGLPVVAQAVAGVPEVVANRVTGLLTPVDDVDAFSSAIAQLLTHPDQRMIMGDAARVRVKSHHTLPAASSQLSTHLMSALEKHHV